MKNFLNTLAFIVGTAVTAVLIWMLLYLCIPGVKDGTDEIFKWGDYKVVEEDKTKETEEPNTDTTLKFENDFIAITIG